MAGKKRGRTVTERIRAALKEARAIVAADEALNERKEILTVELESIAACTSASASIEKSLDERIQAAHNSADGWEWEAVVSNLSQK